MDANKSPNPIRIVMFPWLGYGHISPYLELAKKLTTRGNFIIYLCSTPASLSSIQNKISQKFSESIKLVSFLLPNFPDLPHNSHTTNGLPSHLLPRLLRAFDTSIDAFSHILAHVKSDLLIYDYFQIWAPLVAQKQNIPAVQFITTSSAMTCFMFHYSKNPDIQFPFPKLYFHDYESDLRNTLIGWATNPEGKDRTFVGAERSNKIVLIKAFMDIEFNYLDHLASLVGKKFIPVGPLVEEPNAKDDPSCGIFSWLDKKEKKSIVFISFGSENFLTKEEIDEVAYGLELIISKINFIWIVRFPKGTSSGDSELLEKTLPKGFLERVGNRGKVVQVWVPQTKILGHPNIGGFVSHCGWNSVIESMIYGVPVIAVPLQLDQPLNARLVEEAGVGVEVLRDNNKRLRGETLAAVIKQVVMEDGGESVRQKAGEMREKLRFTGDKQIDRVVNELFGLFQEKNTPKN